MCRFRKERIAQGRRFCETDGDWKTYTCVGAPLLNSESALVGS